MYNGPNMATRLDGCKRGLQGAQRKIGYHTCVCACFMPSADLWPLPGNRASMWQTGVEMRRGWETSEAPCLLVCPRLCRGRRRLLRRALPRSARCMISRLPWRAISRAVGVACAALASMYHEACTLLYSMLCQHGMYCCFICTCCFPSVAAAMPRPPPGCSPLTRAAYELEPPQ